MLNIPFGRNMVILLILSIFLTGIQKLGRTEPQIPNHSLIFATIMADTTDTTITPDTTDTSHSEYLNLTDNERKIAHLRNALRQNPEDTNIMVNLARAYLEVNLLDQARDLSDKVISLDSTNSEAYMIRGRALHAAGEIDEAIRTYQQVIDLDDSNAYAMNNLALIYIEQEKFTDAIPLLEQTVNLNPDEAFFFNNLGIAYEKTGQLPKALESYKKALAIDPANLNAQSNLNRVLQLLQQQNSTAPVSG